jgi:hypothetical protein
MSLLAIALGGYPPGSVITPAMQQDMHARQEENGYRPISHAEQVAKVRPARSCTSHDYFLVQEGMQCANCLWVERR